MKKRVFAATSALALAAALPAMAADLADVRLGAHDGAVTRIVLDLRGGGAGFSYSLSDDGTILTVALRAEAKAPTLPRRKVGLVRAVSAAPVTNGTRISISAAEPVAVVQTGVLAPESGHRFHRIYFDLGPAPAVPPPAPLPPAIAETPPAVTAVASASVAQSTPAPEAHEVREPLETESDHPEPGVTVKLGGVFERSISDYTNVGGATAALQTGLFHDLLEMELGTTALLRDGHTTWKTGLIFKKPLELSENAEIAFGIGPIWLHRPNLGEEADAAKDSAGFEEVGEFVFWPGERRSLGFYTELGYSYDFGKGHEKAVGAGAGVLIPLP